MAVLVTTGLSISRIQDDNPMTVFETESGRVSVKDSQGLIERNRRSSMPNGHEVLCKAVQFSLIASVLSIDSWSLVMSEGLYTISGTSGVNIAGASPWPESP